LLIRRACRPDEEEEVKARRHYRSAKVDNVVYSLGDDVYVKVADCSPLSLPSLRAMLQLLLSYMLRSCFCQGIKRLCDYLFSSQ